MPRPKSTSTAALVAAVLGVAATSFADAAGVPETPLTRIQVWGAGGSAIRAVPEVPNAASVAAIRLGAGHGALLRSDGVLATWGLIAGSTVVPPAVPPSIAVVEIDLGLDHGLARLASGAVVAWGDDAHGQRGIPALAAAAVRIAAGDLHSLALLEGGAIVGWGLDADGQASPPDVDGAVALAAGRDHSVALRADGSLAFWGDDSEGECRPPALGAGETFAAVDCGGDFTLALTSMGRAVAWGVPSRANVPPAPDDVVVTAIVAGPANACYEMSDGTLAVWGDGSAGQLDAPSLKGAVLIRSAVGDRSLVVVAERDCDGNVVSDREDRAAAPELDCDGDGLLDACEIGADAALDCDGDGVLDACEVAADAALDCDGDGRLDACSAGMTSIASPLVAPFGSGLDAVATGSGLAAPVTDVRVEIRVRGDLGGAGESLDLSLNGLLVERVEVPSASCEAGTSTVVLVVPRELWNGLAGDGEVELRLCAAPAVAAAECPASEAGITATWTAEGSDCNGNGIPDLCELRDGLVGDLDADGVPDSCERYPVEDLDLDGRADVLFFDRVSRRLDAWYMDGRTCIGHLTYGTGVGAGWEPVSLGDLDGDGHSDVVFRSVSGGRTWGWLMSGPVIRESAELGYALPASCRLIAVADVDGDRRADLLWRDDATQGIYAWFMDGLVMRGGGWIGSAAGLEFLGAADASGDGRSDLFFRISGNGQVVGWLLDGLAVRAAGPIAGGTPVAADWQPRGLGDLDGDGLADLVWRDARSGRLAAWFLDGLVLRAAGQVAHNPSNAYDVSALADFNGDGRADVFWRSTSTGTAYVWLVDGFGLVGGGLVGEAPVARRAIRRAWSASDAR